ncbi:MAG: hypothetical protein KC583_21135 [Myxococcales bacterium]|nr:hypothetical protein [Myxococcales bacterium]
MSRSSLATADALPSPPAPSPAARPPGRAALWALRTLLVLLAVTGGLGLLLAMGSLLLSLTSAATLVGVIREAR